jgi:zinc D-Ala-D-Ala dipeptidase
MLVLKSMHLNFVQNMQNMRYSTFIIALLVGIGCQSTPPAESKTPETETPAPSVATETDTIKNTAAEPQNTPIIDKKEAIEPATTPKNETVLTREEKIAQHNSTIVGAKPAKGHMKNGVKGAEVILLKEFSNIADLASDIKIDIRYATKNNFTKAQIYDCPKCLLRPAAATALVKVHEALKKQGYGGLKMFDCYRPRPYQQRLWDKVPNPDYVTPPTKGSMHSRGAAVDLTVVDKNGKELDMGTEYDFFGVKAHFDHLDLPEKVLANRRMLRSAMEAAGFEGIRTEWWHFSYRTGKYDFSDYLWPCE